MKQILDEDFTKSDCLTGAEARLVLHELLKMNAEEWKENHRKKGMYVGDLDYIAFDNTGGECWVEEFETKAEAVEWLNEQDEEI